MELYSKRNLDFSMNKVYLNREAENKNITSKNTICLVCGKNGYHNLFITDCSNFVTASGTQLSKFLLKVIGEEPAFFISKFICQQCFMLLDRLDTYLARADEINSHICTRYKETKLQLLGNRQHISELITESLANVKNFKNGTTLNISEELSVTIFHEALPRKRTGPASKPTPLTNSILNRDVSCQIHSMLNNNYLKRKRMSVNDNNSSEIKSYSFKRQRSKNEALIDISDDIIPANNKKIEPASMCNGLRDSESDLESDSSVNSSPGSSFSKSSYKSERSSKSSNSKASGAGSSTTTDDSSSGSNCSSSSSSDVSDNEENNLSIGTSLNTVKGKDNNEHEEVDLEEPMNDTEKFVKDAICKPEPNHISSGVQDPEAMTNHLREAVLVQNSFASNLFQSFLSTSLWMNPPDYSNQKMETKEALDDSQGHSYCEEDVTASSFRNAVSSVSDKKKRMELKNTGQQYVNTKGRLIEAKRVWPQDCSRCPLKCNGRLCEEWRQNVFAQYWGLADYDLQREYLASHMEREEKIGPSGLTRTVVNYYLTHEDKKVQVCRQFFLKTLDVSEKASRIVLEKKHKGELGGGEVSHS